MRFAVPLFIFVALSLVGCASPQKKAQQAERKEKDDNTRELERRRMLAVENGAVNSKRGAEIYMPDPNRAFDPSRSTEGNAHGYGTKGASTKGFDSDRQVRLDTFQTQDFHDKKANAAAEKKYATHDADTHHYLLPDKNPGDKTAATKQSSDANKATPTRELAEARRQYLGQESKKLNQRIDPKTLANWRSGESTAESDGAIEKVSTIKPLSIDDIRDLLNKSK